MDQRNMRSFSFACLHATCLCAFSCLLISVHGGPTHTQVRLLEDGFTVEDDGRGIASDALVNVLGTGYASSRAPCGTSLPSLGYRGEALFLISQLGRLHVVSRAKGERPCCGFAPFPTCFRWPVFLFKAIFLLNPSKAIQSLC